MQQPVYAYILESPGQPVTVFTWPNVAKKYIRDYYTDSQGELRLPPPDRLKLTRCKVNPRAGHAVIIEQVSIKKFLE